MTPKQSELIDRIIGNSIDRCMAIRDLEALMVDIVDECFARRK